MALFGSDLEKKIKKAAAEGEDQWAGVGKEAELRIWRIEQFRVVKWPPHQYGEFHTGTHVFYFVRAASTRISVAHDWQATVTSSSR